VIDIYSLSEIPKKFGKSGLCHYGSITKEELELDCELEYADGYTNIYLDSFDEDFTLFEYMDGFSPNLNKKLHLGHLSNLIFAKTFQSLAIANKTIAIYGDTLEGTDYSNKSQIIFDYKVGKEYFASQMTLRDESILTDGEGKYEGTKVWDNNVMIKSTGATTYFYQDVALRQHLKLPTLYLTGQEQTTHFAELKKYDSNVNHIGLGLVSLNGSKMSSREGNVLFMEEVISKVNEEFNNLELTYNVLAGSLIKSHPTTNKQINLKDLLDVKKSLGLYVSYSLARLSKLPIEFVDKEVSPLVKYMYAKSKVKLAPSTLFSKLVDVCQAFNGDYESKSSQENVELYSQYKVDVEYMFDRLGLYKVGKV
jgi:hypothetical protein